MAIGMGRKAERVAGLVFRNGSPIPIDIPRVIAGLCCRRLGFPEWVSHPLALIGLGVAAEGHRQTVLPCGRGWCGRSGAKKKRPERMKFAPADL